MSPHNLSQKPNDAYFSTPPPSMSSLSPSVMPGITTQGFHPPMNLGPETPISMSGSMHSILPLASITDATRQALLAALSQCAPFGGRKYSFSATTSSPLSPHFPGRSNSISDTGRNLPSKSDFPKFPILSRSIAVVKLDLSLKFQHQHSVPITISRPLIFLKALTIFNVILDHIFAISTLICHFSIFLHCPSMCRLIRTMVAEILVW